ncbi:hypothetical protein ACA910_014872 [Epithemia clementina (nom. ined.)]
MFEYHRLSTACSPIPTTTYFKPGGVALITTNSTTGRVIATGSDEMGRWTFQSLLGRDKRQITIISAYQVCSPSSSQSVPSALTAHSQQVSILRQQHRSLSPRQSFVTDLTHFIKSLQHAGHGIILAGDFNEPLGFHASGMTKLCTDCALADLLLHMTGQDNFKTWQRGTDRRIDYVLCSDWIVETAVSACYEPFQYQSKGDHRNICIDFDLLGLFGNPTYCLASPSQREFRATDRKSVATYLTVKHAYLSQHNFFQRLDQLTQHWDPALAEQLDRDFQRASVTAAKACVRKPNLPYVRKLACLRQEKNVLCRILSQSRTGQSLAASIAHLTTEGHSFLLPESLEACQARCRTLQREIRDMQKCALSSRKHEQLRQIEDATARGDRKTAKIIRHIMAAERTKALYRRLRLLRSGRSGGLSHLEVPADPNETNYNSCTEWITIDTPPEVEQKLRERNQQHFGQAAGTFPTVPPFSEWIDWTASTHVAELLLEGSFSCPPDMDELTQLLLSHMRKRCNLDSIPGLLTRSEWVEKIKSWPENTSTSPSGFHLSHSKVLIASHGVDPDSPDGADLEAKRNALIDAQVSLLNAAIQNQYSYDRWKTVVNVMILKEPGNHKIHRLRVIHLYEQDYNLLLAVKWRALIQQSTNSGLLHPCQFGGVPGRDAIQPTIIEELQYEISRASKRPLVHLDYDATACYDRIVMPLSSLISRSFGQHRSIVYINAHTLQEAKYLLKTKLGVSESFYKHCSLFPIYGSGQGAGNSPGLWCCISSVLFSMFDDVANGAQFVSPDRQYRVQIFLVGFVDDTSSSVNDFLAPSPLPVAHYVQKAQHDAQKWNDILQLSGGALNLQKCSYHVMYYQFTPSGLPVLQGGTFTPNLTIQFSTNSSSTPLRQLPASSAHRTLGVQKAPSGTTIRGFQQLSHKVTQHANLIARSPLTRSETWTYYHAIAIPSITFPLPSMSLSSSQCNSLQTILKQAVLPKYGFNRNFPNALVYGHSDYTGLEFRSLFVEQGLAQVLSLLTCLRSQGVAHQLACIALMWAQFLAGTGVSILVDVHTPLPQLDPLVWLPSLRRFLSSIACSLAIELPQLIPPLQRSGDAHLMDVILQGSFRPSQIKVINGCQLYLGVRLLSDITTSDGTAIYSNFYYGTPHPHHHPKELQAYQSRPHAPAWRLWRAALSLFTCPNSLQLRRPLGRWLHSGSALFRNWLSYATHSPPRVYLRKLNQYDVYIPRSGQRLEYSGMVVSTLPRTAVPIDVDLSSSPSISYQSWPISPLRLPPPAIPATFSAFVESLPEWEFELLRHVSFLDGDVFTFALAAQPRGSPLSSVPLFVATDGSAPQFRGSFGWVCAFSDGRRVATNCGSAPGSRTSSFRAEAYGILSALRFLLRVFEFTGHPLPRVIHLYSDSRSVLQRLETVRSWSFYYPNFTLLPEWDVLQAIATTLRSFGTRLTLHYIKAHQDRTSSLSSLPLPAQLNSAADGLASSYPDMYGSVVGHTRVPLIGGAMAVLHSSAGTITSNFRPFLRRLASFQASHAYLCSSYNWSHTTFKLVDWDSHGRLVRQWYPHKHFISKFVNDWLPVGSKVARYSPLYPDSCPGCGHSPEDRTHFLQCSSFPWFGPTLAALQMFQRAHPTHPVLFDLLCDALRKWATPSSIPSFSLPSSFTSLVTHQASIGWDQLLFGRFARAWSELHDALRDPATSSLNSLPGNVWVGKVIHIIWTQIHASWLSRNHARHGRDKISHEASLTQQALRETAALYDLRDLVIPRDRALFYSSLQAHQEALPSASSLRQWLLTWGPVIRQSVLLSQQNNTTHTLSLRSYFLPS